jgi:hypothetical protein
VNGGLCECLRKRDDVDVQSGRCCTKLLPCRFKWNGKRFVGTFPELCAAIVIIASSNTAISRYSMLSAIFVLICASSSASVPSAAAAAAAAEPSVRSMSFLALVSLLPTEDYMPVWMLCHAKPIFLRRPGAGNELPKFLRLSAFCFLNYFPNNLTALRC